MSEYTFKINNNDYKIFHQRYKYYGVKNNTSNKYIVEKYKWNDVVISVYKNDKNELKIVIQGKNRDEFVQKNADILHNSSGNIRNITNNAILNHYDCIGSDEVGVGDYFGGICVCAVMVGKEQITELKELGVKDSKKLSDAKIMDLAEKIKRLVQYKVCNISPKQYNILMTKFNNSHIIKTYLHYKAIANLDNDVRLKNKITNYKIVIDQYANNKNMVDYLIKLGLSNGNASRFMNGITLTTHAESKCLAVACASIIARDSFLKTINALEIKYNDGALLPLGAKNTKISDECENIINKNGIKNKNQLIMFFNNLVKIHFKNTDEIIKKHNW